MPGVFLTDFGLAKDVTGQAMGLSRSKLTREGVTLGTPAYMSPEQARGEFGSMTPASDVWALGCVLHEVLAGRTPFQGETPAAVIGAILTETPVPPPGAPAPVRQLLAVALQKDAAARHQSASVWSTDCRRVLDGLAPLARVQSGRWPSVLVAAGLALAAFTVGGFALWGRGGTPEPPAPTDRRDPIAAEAARAWSLRRTEPARARALLAALATRAPDRHEIRVQLGVLHWLTGDALGARTAWFAVPETAPEWERAQLYLALEAVFDAHQETLRLDRALPFLGRIAGRPSDVGTLAEVLCDLSRRVDEGTVDRADMVRRLDAVPGWEARTLLALVALVRGTPIAEQLPLLNRALADGVPLAWTLAARGRALRGLGRYAEAAADCNAALALQPDLVIALGLRAECRIGLGELEAALADYEHILRAQPGHPEAIIGRADVLQRLHREAEALRLLEPDLARTDLQGRAWTLRARLLGKLGDLPEALRASEEAVARGDTSVDLHLLRGMLFRDLGRLPEALAALDRAAQLAPDEAHSFSERALVRRRMGDVAGAIADYDRALELDPDLVSALVNRGRAKLELRDPEGAVADWSRALELEPERVEARINRGTALRTLGRLDAAIHDLERAEGQAPEQPVVLFSLARAYRDVGRLAEAAQRYRRFLRVVPNHGHVPLVRRELAAVEQRLAAGEGR